MQRLLLTCALLAVVSLGAWRSRHSDTSQSVYAVEGRLLVADKPAANAALAFHPIRATTASVHCPVAMTRPDGTFQLTTHRLNDGAPAGEYVVTVIWHDPSKPVDECACEDPAIHDRLCGLYADPGKSPLRSVVKPEKNQIQLVAEPCSERQRFEMQLRRSGAGSILNSFLGDQNEKTIDGRSK